MITRATGTVFLVTALFLSAVTHAHSAVTLHGLFTDGAVLQRGIHVPVWGTAGDGESVTVTFRGQSVSSTASGGKWKVSLSPMTAGGPYTLTVSGENTITLNNIMVGEVWVCGGQSNMVWSLAAADNAAQAIANSSDPGLRLFSVPYASSAIRQSYLPAGCAWAESSPASSPAFSAVGYFFGRELRRRLNVPVGLIQSAVGGTPAQYWMDEFYVNGLNIVRNQDYGLHYYPMICPLQPYAIKGAIWYQGESNAWEAYQYQKLFGAMINCWRTDWGQGSFPFLFVQLAPFTPPSSEPRESSWAELREAQLKTSLTVPRTAMAVITDVGDPNDVHPTKKEPVGVRLALSALSMVYRRMDSNKGSKNRATTGPIFKRMDVSGDTAVITFDGVGKGLVAKDGPLTGFTISGSDRVFRNTQAEIRGEAIVVSSPQVTKPVAVRFGWDDCPIVNLFNQEGFPASPFRTDSYPGITAPAGAP